jgi:hypothetical protein
MAGRSSGRELRTVRERVGQLIGNRACPSRRGSGPDFWEKVRGQKVQSGKSNSCPCQELLVLTQLDDCGADEVSKSLSGDLQSQAIAEAQMDDGAIVLSSSCRDTVYIL